MLENADSLDHGDNLDTVTLNDQYDRIPCDTKYRNGSVEAINVFADSTGYERIYLNHKIAKINSENSILKIIVKMCIYSTKNITIKHVLVPTSIGALKHNMASILSRPLPDKKWTAILNMGFGEVVKIYMEYETPFCGIDGHSKYHIGVNDSQYNQRNTIWTNGLSAFYMNEKNPNVLATVYIGDLIIKFEEIDSEQLITELTNLLRYFLGDQSIPRPKSLVLSQWVSNPLIRGKYSHLSFKSIPSDYITKADSIQDNCRRRNR